EKFWAKLLQAKFEKSFHQAIPETSDYQEHKVEINIDGLPIGQYALLTSPDPQFSSQQDLGLSTFFSSSIAYIKNGLDYFVVDRNSGHPLKGVVLTTFTRKYTSGNNNFVTEKTYRTDAHGLIRLTPNRDDAYKKVEFRFNNDFLSTNGYINYYPIA